MHSRLFRVHFLRLMLVLSSSFHLKICAFLQILGTGWFPYWNDEISSIVVLFGSRIQNIKRDNLQSICSQLIHEMTLATMEELKATFTNKEYEKLLLNRSPWINQLLLKLFMLTIFLQLSKVPRSEHGHFPKTAEAYDSLWRFFIIFIIIKLFFVGNLNNDGKYTIFFFVNLHQYQ